MADLIFLGVKRLIVTGSFAFIGAAIVRLLLQERASPLFNLNHWGYASDATGIVRLGTAAMEWHHLDWQLVSIDWCHLVLGSSSYGGERPSSAS